MIALDGVHLTVNGQQWRLRFTWASLLKLHDAWGEDFEKRAAIAVEKHNLRDLAMMVECAGGPARDDVIEASPAIFPTKDALEVAWNWGYLGFEAAQKFQKELAKERAEAAKAPGKKSPLSRFFSGFAMLWKTRQEAA